MYTLDQHYLIATEWNMATLAGLLLRKGSPKGEVKRQTKICLDMLTVCQTLSSEALSSAAEKWSRINVGRVVEVLDLAKSMSLTSALTQWVESAKG